MQSSEASEMADQTTSYVAHGTHGHGRARARHVRLGRPTWRLQGTRDTEPNRNLKILLWGGQPGSGGGGGAGQKASAQEAGRST